MVSLQKVLRSSYLFYRHFPSSQPPEDKKQSTLSAVGWVKERNPTN